MLDLKLLRESPDLVREALKNRKADADLDAVLQLEVTRRQMLHEVEQLRAEQNRASQEIADAKKAKRDASDQIAEMRALSTRIKELDDRRKGVEAELEGHLLNLPNIPHETTPVGTDELDNRLERTWGDIPEFEFEVKDHIDLGEALGILDFDCASKLAGARFCLFRGAGSRLERALINFMLDTHTEEHEYLEILPPFLASSETMQGSGQLPKFASEAFRIADSDLWLVPTAEVPLTNIHRGEILAEADLPLLYVAYTPCFRSEAGSYGKDVRGLLRNHQFDKVELYKFSKPEDSWDDLEKLTANAESILQRLGLPYRVVTLSTGDLGFSAAKTYDLEVWLPGQNTYREISSCSNCTDFQARRANIRYRADGKPQFVHTLNGSGLAVGRTVIAIMENYQQADGSIEIPPVLRSYMGGRKKIEVPDA